MIAYLFEYYLHHLDEVPQEYMTVSQGSDVRAVVDHIAGMTDRFAIASFTELIVPREWRSR